MKNIEIEIRIKLDNPYLFKEWLKKSAKQIKTVDQIDIYFDPPHKSFITVDSRGYKNADEWLRLRISQNKNEICYKYWHTDKKTGKSTHADEIETTIGDPEQIQEIFKRLGFKRIAMVSKHRESWQYGDFRFDCDNIENLGFFVEIEFHGEIDNPAKGKQKIFDFLNKIGIKDWKKIKGGYPWMFWNIDKNLFEDID